MPSKNELISVSLVASSALRTVGTSSEFSHSQVRKVQTPLHGAGGSCPSTGKCSVNGSKRGMGNLNILDSGLMRVMGYSTLFIEEPLFRTLFSNETGQRYMEPRLSLFRLYMENPSELQDIWQVITWLDIIVSCDSHGLGIGFFEALLKSGTASELTHQIYTVL